MLPAGRLARSGGRPVRYLDTGEPGYHPVTFFGGLGTSAGAFALTEFAQPERDRLGLRFISVERNGFGATAFTPSLGFAEAVDDVLAVLEELTIGRFSVVAISGGGPYAARLVARVPERVVSLHLAAVVSGGPPNPATSRLLADVEAIASDPATFWEYPAESRVREIPGFMEAARAEGRHALGDRARAAAALRHEIALITSEPLPALDGYAAPAYLYWGEEDDVVPVAHAAAWQASLPRVDATRTYPGEGHDVQYLHWSQILRDIAETAR